MRTRRRPRPATAAIAGVLSASVSVGKTATIRSIRARDPTVEALGSVETVVRGRSRTPTRLCRLSRREKIQTETAAIALLSSNSLSDSRPQSPLPFVGEAALALGPRSASGLRDRQPASVSTEVVWPWRRLAVWQCRLASVHRESESMLLIILYLS